jgi:hypothetical protein
MVAPSTATGRTAALARIKRTPEVVERREMDDAKLGISGGGRVEMRPVGSRHRQQEWIPSERQGSVHDGRARMPPILPPLARLQVKTG